MSERYGIGTVPIREALNRLSSEGLVERRSHRGFCVAPISLADLGELVQTRIWLETLALRESIRNADEAFEDALVVSFHRLARTQRLLPDATGSELPGRNLSEEWERLHKDFHLLLLDRCGSSLLLGFCSNLMDQAVRYRNLSMNTNPSRQRREGAAAEHKEILDAVLDRDADRACELLADHYRGDRIQGHWVANVGIARSAQHSDGNPRQGKHTAEDKDHDGHDQRYHADQQRPRSLFVAFRTAPSPQRINQAGQQRSQQKRSSNPGGDACAAQRDKPLLNHLLN